MTKMKTMKTIKSLSGQLWALIAPAGTQANENDISFFDVKELYDAAYAEKAAARTSLSRFKALMAQAEALDTAYRAQLAARRPGPAAALLSGKAA
jgi:hypothetical protein